jgi:hypothetical protein
MLSLPTEILLQICSYFKTPIIYIKISNICRILYNLIKNNMIINSVFYKKIMRKLYNIHNNYKTIIFWHGVVFRNNILNSNYTVIIK